MKRVMLISLFIIFKYDISKAQQGKAIPNSYNYPSIRPFALQYESINQSTYTFKNQEGEHIYSDPIRQDRWQAFASHKLYQKEQLILLGNALFTQDRFHSESAGTEKFNTLQLSASAIYTDSLWGKPIVYHADLVFSSPKIIHIQKVISRASASLILKADADMRLSAGLIALLDPSMIGSPVLPIISYWKKLGNPNWVMDFILPYKASFRKADFLSGWLSLGAEIRGSNFFIPDSKHSLSGQYEYRYTNLYTGAYYERSFGKLLLGTQLGYRSSLQSRALKVYHKNSDFILEAKTKSSPFFLLNMALALPYQTLR